MTPWLIQVELQDPVLLALVFISWSLKARGEMGTESMPKSEKQLYRGALLEEHAKRELLFGESQGDEQES